MSIVKPLIYGLLGLGFVRESRQVRKDFPDEAGEVYSRHFATIALTHVCSDQ